MTSYLILEHLTRGLLEKFSIYIEIAGDPSHLLLPGELNQSRHIWKRHLIQIRVDKTRNPKVSTYCICVEKLGELKVSNFDKFLT